MTGIVVGVDSSEHSQRSLEWAMREAAIRKVPLTVITVNAVVAGFFSSPVVLAADEPAREQARQGAQEAADKGSVGARRRVQSSLRDHPRDQRLSRWRAHRSLT